MEIIKLFKKKRKIICYVFKDSKGFHTFTGKPSDTCCIGWSYNNLKDAMNTAKEYFENYTKPF